MAKNERLPMPDRLASLDLIAVSVTPKTVWTFVRATGADGVQGIGEATLTGQETAIAVVAERAGPGVVQDYARDAGAIFGTLPFETIAEASFSSGLMQALRDLEARQQGVPVASLLGGMQRTAIPTYANINRRTLDRTPEGFAASVADPLAAGHQAFKIAPFDDLTPQLDEADARPLIAAGIARIEAVRDAIGPEKRLMVDCHWRFRTERAMEAMEALRPVGLYWFECAIPETDETIPDLVKLRAQANAQGVLHTGMEMGVLREAFRPYLKAGAYDVMMPDVKYAGGSDEMMRIAEEFAEAGVTFSPHNPSGPICHAHSLQLCAALPDEAVLETQYDETPLFDELVGQALPQANGGIVTLDSSLAGIGVSLANPVLEALQAKVLWQAGA